MQNLLRGLVSAVVLGAVLWVGIDGAGPVPPLGPFLDPMTGVWAVATNARYPAHLGADIPGLDGPLSVLFDDRAVPHIFASTEDDAARALGYVVARDRLFQMEIQTRAAAGTLSELVGRPGLQLDRYARRMALATSAESTFAAADTTDRGMAQVLAYAEGVNAWIAQMEDRDTPLEYRLLNRRPLRWQPVFSYYFIRQMGLTLAGYAHDLRRERVVALVGSAAADALFPIHSPIQEPIQPNGAAAPRFEDVVIPPPSRPVGPPGLLRTVAATPGGYGALSDGPVGASNNWVVSGSRTESGHVLLAGDPHLDLSLPSIWYEAHLVVPGKLDVYGVTFPGIPGIVIGFNRHVAWSFTNTGADVMDFYEETVDDDANPTAYLLDGEWVPLAAKVEEYRGPDGSLLAVDTVRATHRGPIRRDGDRILSMRWTVLETGGELAAFDRIVHATSVAEWIDGMAGYRSPPQNGVVGDVDGNIALYSFGWYPERAGDGDGLVVRDGTTRASDWVGEWDRTRYPGATNPEQGYLASANQEPIDPRVNPGFLGADWLSPWRAMQINRLLRANDSADPGDMRRYQTHPGSARADYFIPFLIDAAQHVGSEGVVAQASEVVEAWNREYTRDSRGAVLFEWTMDRIVDLVWDELVDTDSGSRVATPAEAVLAVLMTDPDNAFWDRIATGEVEGRNDIIIAALGFAYQRALETLGPFGEGWAWENIGQANIYHLIRSPALSALGIPVQAGIGTLGAWSRSGQHGPSWRMVVELGDTVRAWSTYPGGQSGNPMSDYYDDRIQQWSEGNLDDVLFPPDSDALPADRVIATYLLRPGR